MPDLASFVSFHSNSALYNTHVALKKLVLIAIDRAVREVSLQAAFMEGRANVLDYWPCC
jgi:hypothetical protein